MANVDLVDLIPILKAIRNIKREYKQAIQTEYDDFSLYPVLTENFLDTCYNNGYVVGFKQAWKDYLGSEEVEVTLPREMRELVPASFSDSGDADYDTLTSIMSFCLSIRQELKTVLDLDTDLFELYPPQVAALAEDNYVQGLQDGYIVGMQAAGSVAVPMPSISCHNNVISISSSIENGIIYWRTDPLEEWNIYSVGDPRLVITEDTPVWAYTSLGTKTSDVNYQLALYVDFYSPVITFNDTTNKAIIDSSYPTDSEVKTKYRLSTWESFIDFLDYDGMAIPISQALTIYAYNYLGEQVSETVSLDCIPNVTPTTKPATPTLTFNSYNNVLTITTTTSGAQIYYRKVGTNDWLLYSSAIALIESGTYEAFCSLRGVNSDTSSPLECTVTNAGSGGGNPSAIAPPVIIPGNNSFTITCSTPGVTIMWQDVNTPYPSIWKTYSDKVDITSTRTIKAKSILNREEAYSVPVTVYYYEIQGGGSTTTVAPPVISCNASVISISCSTVGATIYYRKEGDTSWTQYSSPFTILESATYEAKAVKDSKESEISSNYCNAEIPSAPVISISGFTVSMSTETAGADIKYRVSGASEWLDYGQPFDITDTTTFEAKAINRLGIESTVTTTTCTVAVDPCTISFANNIVSISCPSTGATIYYKKSTDTTWTVYTGPFRIYSSAVYEAKAEKNNYSSTITSLQCTYVPDRINEYLTIELIEPDPTVDIFIELGTWHASYKINDGQWIDAPGSMGDRLNKTGWNDGDKIFIKLASGHQHYRTRIRVYGWNGNSVVDNCVTYKVYGNILSLVYGDNFSNYNTTENISFGSQFDGDVNLVDASELVLPLPTSNGCYQYMFDGCENLVSAPNLSGFSSVSERCFEGMFRGCASLTTAPELTATTLADYCFYEMFYGCTSLTTAPSLSATTLVRSCYSMMFQYCTSLATAPELPATTLVQSCYDQMFYGCTSLNYVKCLATDISATNCTFAWLDSTSNTGTFVKASGTSWSSGRSGIPSGWTVQEV